MVLVKLARLPYDAPSAAVAPLPCADSGRIQAGAKSALRVLLLLCCSSRRLPDPCESSAELLLALLLLVLRSKAGFILDVTAMSAKRCCNGTVPSPASRHDDVVDWYALLLLVAPLPL